MFASKIYIDPTDPQTYEDNYKSLMRWLFEKPLHTKPKLGTPLSYLDEAAASRPATQNKARAVKAAVDANKPQTRGLLRNFFDAYLEALNDLEPAMDADPSKLGRYLFGTLTFF